MVEFKRNITLTIIMIIFIIIIIIINFTRAATQECLDRHVLQKADGTGSKLYIGRTMDRINIKLRLPADVTCTQCVLQWRYHAGRRSELNLYPSVSVV